MTKIISLTDQVYGKLKRMKKSRSFSQEINELIDKFSTKGDVRELRRFMGAWSKEEAEAYQREVAAIRKSTRPRYFT